MVSGINWGNTPYGNLDSFKAKVQGQPKKDLPPPKTYIEERPDDAPLLLPPYEKRTDGFGYGGKVWFSCK